MGILTFKYFLVLQTLFYLNEYNDHGYMMRFKVLFKVKTSIIISSLVTLSAIILFNQKRFDEQELYKKLYDQWWTSRTKIRLRLLYSRCCLQVMFTKLVPGRGGGWRGEQRCDGGCGMWLWMYDLVNNLRQACRMCVIYSNCICDCVCDLPFLVTWTAHTGCSPL